MAAVLGLVGMVVGLASFVCGIIILIGAFKSSVADGLLSLCIPFYILYFAIAKFEHEKKGLIVGVWLGAVVLNIILQVVTIAAA